MTKHRLLPLAAALALFGAACDRTPTVPNLNNPSVEDFAGSLTNEKLRVLLVGVLSQERTELSQRYYSFTTTLGRDSYRLDTSEPRFLTETLESTGAAGGFVGGGVFTDFYVAVKASNNLLGSLNNTPELTANERSLVKGFVETLKAHDLFRVAEMINGGVRDDDEVHLLQLVGPHRVAGAVVKIRINEDASAVGVDEFVGGDAEETKFCGAHG